jgi:hypothetical protein
MFWAFKRNTESGPLYRNGSRTVRKKFWKEMKRESCDSLFLRAKELREPASTTPANSIKEHKRKSFIINGCSPEIEPRKRLMHM